MNSAENIGQNLSYQHPKESFPVKEKAKPYSYAHEGNETAALLIHGFTGSPYDMKELADYLFAHGIDVHVVRIAGHGTHIDDLMSTTYVDWLASVKKAVDEVAVAGKGIFLVGYSFGANIALDLASQEPEKYKGVVCLGTSIFWRSRLYYYVLYQFLRFFQIKKVRKPYVPKYKVEAFESTGNYSEFPTSGLGEFRKIVSHHTKEQLHLVTTPALIIHSRDDRISHPRSSDFLFDNIGSSYKEMFVLKELNHNPLRSENKDKIFERVVQFIQS